MKRSVSLFLAFGLLVGCFAGCGKSPEEIQSPTEPPVEPGLELEENGIVYESLAQKAVIKTALAYLARGSRIQYDDTNMLTSGAGTMYRWQYGARAYPEAYTDQNIGYTNCAAFAYDVYWSALNVKIGGYTTKVLTDVDGKQRIYSYYPTGEETEEQKQAVEADFRSNLKPGDLIVIRYNGAKDGNGHAMLYVGSKVLEGVEGYRGTAAEGTDSESTAEDARFNYDIIHSTGSSYSYGEGVEKYEQNGTVQMMSTGSLFDPSTGRYVFGKLKSIVILRPLAVFEKDIPENTLNRMKHMDNVVAEKLSSHPSGRTVNPGENITYRFCVTNKNSEAVNLTITDTVPALATFVSADKTYPCKVEGDSLLWQVSIPANETITVSYDVQVKADAQPGQSIASDKGLVGGVAVPCPKVFVARTLDSREQADLLAAVTAMSDSKLLKGVDLLNALYGKALKVEEILPEDLDSLWAALFQSFEDLSYINGKSVYANAIVPGMLGGRNLMQRPVSADISTQVLRLDTIRTRLPYGYHLVVGDVVLGESSSGERVMYMYTGTQMLNMFSSGEPEHKETQSCLDPLMSYKRFLILRPSMLLDDQTQ